MGHGSHISARTLLLAGVLLVLAGLCARMLLGARRELAAAREATAKGDTHGQVMHLRRAMTYYLPGNPWVSEAHHRLRDHCRRTQVQRQRHGALVCWRELRGAVLRLRGLTRPFAASLDEANRNIAALSASSYAFGVSAAGRDKLLARLNAPPEPHAVWTLVALWGFLLWVGGAVLLLFRGLRPDASVIWRRLWPLALAVAAGFALFCAGLSQA